MLRGEGYSNTGQCPRGEDNWYGVINYEGDYEEAVEGTRYNFCFKRFRTNEDDEYYEIRVFYEFSLPFLGPISVFPITGRTDNFMGSNNQILDE